MSTSFVEGLVIGSLRSGTSVLYATLGEVLVERAGIVNLGVEGAMLMGACIGFIATAQTGSVLVGILAAALAGGLFNLLLAFLVVTRRANQLASGLALMFFGLGLTAFLGRPYVGRRIEGLNHDILMYLVFPLAAFLWVGLFHTRSGLVLRAVGENRTAACAAGLRPSRIQYQALFLGGVLGALGGAHLALAFTQIWVEGMTAVRGFIAVALVIFSAWHPLIAVAGALLFGGAVAFQLQLQARGAPVSPFLLDMIPYLLTLTVLLFWGRTRKHTMPQGLKEVFEGTE